MESITCVAACVVLVLCVGVRYAIANIDSDIAVIARKLGVKGVYESTSVFWKVEKAIANP